MQSTAEQPSPNVLGTVSQGLSIISFINTAYSAYQTHEYRAAVTQKLAEILNELKSIEEGIRLLDTKSTFCSIWNGFDNPLNRLAATYTRWAEATTEEIRTQLLKDSLKDIDLAMTQIHMAVCGKNDNPLLPPVAQAYVDAVAIRDWDTSPLEMVYQYFDRIIVGTLLQGLGLLGAAAKAKVDPLGYYTNWQKLLTAGNPDAAEDDLKESYLAHEGKQFQKVIHDNADYLSWAGRFRDVNNESLAFAMVRCGEGGNIPDGHAVLGYDLVEGEVGDGILIKMWHGPVGEDGYTPADKISVAYSGGDYVSIETEYYEHTTDRANYRSVRRKALTHYDQVRVKEGRVIIDMRWHCHGTTTTDEYGEDVHNHYFYMAARHAPLKAGGVIDMDNAEWMDWDADHEWVDFAKVDDRKHWLVHWANYHEKPANWNTPISGFWFNQDQAAFRADVHKKSFTE
jgi:hypothetical protein